MRHAPIAVLAGFVALSGVACGASEDNADPASSADAIIGGKTDPSDDAVVELVESIGSRSSGDEYTCTATFISRTALLTAAHCVVSEKNPKKLQSGASFRVMKASSRDTARSTDWISVKTANIHPHPGYDGDAAHDVAVIVLDHPVDVVPMALRRTPLTKAMVGSAVRIVGYGQNKRKASASDGSETRRSADTTLRGLEGDLVHIGKTGQQACDGDSGGPALLVVDGVVTLIATDDVASTDVDCTQGDLYQRVDLHLDFIDRYL